MTEGIYANNKPIKKYNGKNRRNLNKLNGVLFLYICFADFLLKYSNRDWPMNKRNTFKKFDICIVYPGFKLEVGRIGTYYWNNKTITDVGKITKIIKYNSSIV